MKKQEEKAREVIENLDAIKSLDVRPSQENQKPYNIWHPIKGEWIHLTKTDNGFYTNGKLEKNYPQVT